MFSVLVPVYNDLRFVAEALDSLLAQTWVDWEAVVVDDGSSDGTQSVLEDYARRDHRFRLVRQANAGTAAALNTALLEARGDWICWLSSDDLFDERKLEVHRRWIQVTPSCRFFLTDSRELDQTTGLLDEPAFGLAFPPPERQVLQMLLRNYIHGNSICVSRLAWLEVGTFDPALDWAQDYDMWLRLLVAHAAVFIPERTCTTRIHPGQDTVRFPGAGNVDSARAVIQLLAKHELASLVPSLATADRSSRREALRLAIAVAANTSAVVYAAGSHPLLLMRIVEWLQSNADAVELALDLRLLRRASVRVNHSVADAEFALMWRTVAAVAEIPHLLFRVEDADPWRVIERCIIRGRASDLQQAKYLALYQAFRGVASPAGGGAASVSPHAGVVALESSLDEQGRTEAEAPSGTRRRVPEARLRNIDDGVVVISRGADALNWAGGFLHVRVSTEPRLRALLGALGARPSGVNGLDPGGCGSFDAEPQTYDLLSLYRGRAPFHIRVTLDVLRLWAPAEQWMRIQARRARILVGTLAATAPRRWPSAVRELSRERERRRHLGSARRAREAPRS